MIDTRTVMLCGHCGNRTILELRGEFKYRTHPYFREGKMHYTTVVWSMLECQTCSKPTLVRLDDDEDPFIEPIILYPPITAPLTDIPKEIEKEYEATLKVRNISSNACAVLARRTLEAIFTHESAVGRTLIEKVNNLIKSERIPPLLADAAHLGRQIGNLGAHFDKGKATEEDVAAMLDFLEAILEYLYVVPAKVAAVKTRLNKTP